MHSRDLLAENTAFQAALADESLSFYQDKHKKWWFCETIHKSWGQRIEVDDFELYQKTDYQTVVVFYNKELGHVMLLDGAVQIAENNWVGYQEMFVAATMLPQYTDSTQLIEVLIIGGGDGGVATVALDLFPNARVTMVEIDRGVVEAAKQYLPEISKSLTANNPNFDLIIGNGIEYVKDPSNRHKFAAIIVDCTDPNENGPAEGLFGTDFQYDLKQCLKEGGIVLQQSGVLDLQIDEVKQSVAMMKGLYKYPVVYTVPMLTYPGTMALVGGSDVKIDEMSLEELESRFSKFQLAGKTQYVNPKILFGSCNSLPEEHRLWLDEILQPAMSTKMRFF